MINALYSSGEKAESKQCHPSSDATGLRKRIEFPMTLNPPRQGRKVAYGRDGFLLPPLKDNIQLLGPTFQSGGEKNEFIFPLFIMLSPFP